jgi:hypothetical protein
MHPFELALRALFGFWAVSAAALIAVLFYIATRDGIRTMRRPRAGAHRGMTPTGAMSRSILSAAQRTLTRRLRRLAWCSSGFSAKQSRSR